MVQLNASVTLEKDNDPSMDNELVKILMEEIQKEIDEDIMRKVLVEEGWIDIPFTYLSNKQAVDIIDWCTDTFTENQWKRLTGSFVFQNKKDAEWFILRWA